MYRLAVITDTFQNYQNYYDQYPELKNQDYETQLNFFRNLPPGSYMPYDYYLRKLGVDAECFFFDAEHLHRTWACERSVIPDPTLAWAQQAPGLLLGQLAEFRPDVVFIYALRWRSDDFLSSIKDNVRSVRIVAAQEGGILRPGSLRDIDILFVCVPSYVDIGKKMGVRTELLYHAFDTRILSEVENKPADQRDIPFSFSGASGYGMGPFHLPRFWGLLDLFQRTPLEAWLDEAALYQPEMMPTAPEIDERISRASGFIKANEIGNAANRLREVFQTSGRPPPFPLSRLFPSRCHPAVFGLPMFDLLGRSRLTFNMHSTPPGRNVGNIRLFEATGMGACLITDAADNLADLFIADDEVISYRTIDEAVDKINNILINPSLSHEISSKGNKKTVSFHSYMNRSEEINEKLTQLLIK